MKKLEYRSTNPRKRQAINEKKSTEKKGNIQKRKVNKEKNKVEKDMPKKGRKSYKILVLFLILALLIAGGYLLCTLSNFDVQEIKINDTSRYTKDEIVEKSDLKLNDNIFLQTFKGISDNIKELPYVENVKIKLQLPNVITLSVEERVSTYFAYDKENNRFFRIDSNGYILEQSDINEKSKEELLVYGFIFDNEVKLGEKLNDVDISKIVIYNRVAAEFEKSAINGSITKVNFENSLTTITLNDKLNVVLPNDTEIKYNMNFLKSIIGKIGEDSVGVIDMTKKNPTFSSF